MYGKSNKQDLTKQDIQSKTRMQLFFEIFGVKYMELIKLNLILIMYLLPAIVWTGMNFNVLFSEEVVASGSAIYRLVYFAGLIPCLLIAAPAISGAAYVIRNFTQDRHAWLWSDFRERAKENRKQAILYMLVFTAFLFIGQLVLTAYSVIGTGSMFLVFARALFIVTYIFVILSSMYVYPMMVTYELSLKDIIRNSLLLTIGKLIGTIGIAIGAIVPAIIFLLLSMLHGAFLIVLGLYFVLIGIAFAMYVTITYTTAVFEEVLVPSEEDEDEAMRAILTQRNKTS